MQRKRICILTSMPESIHGQRILDGIFTQCRKYGYHAAVFATMTSLLHFDKAYRAGEENIYNLPNFDRFDGVIVDTITFGGGSTHEALEKIRLLLARRCHVPVVSLELPLLDYKVIENNNDPVLRAMCHHVTEVHGKRDICILTGAADNEVALYRLGVMLDELRRLDITVPEERIAYGDFWYSGGERLADEIAAGERTMPEAFLCTSDHMALGLIERLKHHGYSVPGDAVVIGFDATIEAALNETPLTTYAPNDAGTAAKAVDYLRSVIEPGAPVLPYETDGGITMRAGESCGCSGNLMRSVSGFRDALYYTMRNYNPEMRQDDVDIGLLMENYVSEQFTAAETAEDCLHTLLGSSYLLHPLRNHYLCLADDWLTDHTPGAEGYPAQMRLVSAYSTTGEPIFCLGEQSVLFATDQMLPQMLAEEGEPSVFYFCPVHFGDKTFGYTVLQRSLTEQRKLNLVYRNWLRLVNNSLEMMRAKHRYMLLSSHDEMTGLLNRRGFFTELQKLIRDSRSAALHLAVLSVDLDLLKTINDTYGHGEGDLAITAVGRALRTGVGGAGICARFGGDEFAAAILLTKQETQGWYDGFLQRFHDFLRLHNETSGKPYRVGASIGFATEPLTADLNTDALINKADAMMYADKTARKAARGI